MLDRVRVVAMGGIVGLRTGRQAHDAALVAALAAGESQAVAAAQAGVSVRTLRRRLNDPSFVAQLDALGRHVRRRVADELAGGALEAVQTLRALLGRDYEPVVQLRAADALLTHSTRVAELELEHLIDGFETRLRDAEQRMVT
jgi:hypothetical protein